MFRASRPPLEGGFAAFREYVLRDFTRIQNAFSKSAEVEEGAFTPTFDFATTGDLSNSYSDQSGYYWRVGALLHFSVRLSVTPTHTTSSGEAQVGGLPYTSKSGSEPRSIIQTLVGGTGITLPGSRTEVQGVVNGSTDYVRLTAAGSGAALQALTASDIGTGVALEVRASGFYPIK